MNFSVLLILAIGLIGSTQCAKNLDSKIDDKKTEKRGVIDIHGTAYATSAPALAQGTNFFSHGPAILPAVTATPGIVYAPEKQIVATASPSQIYAKPSPHYPIKISDAVLAGQQQTYSGLLSNQLYQAPQAYQQVAKVQIAQPTYAVSAPIQSQLAYSKHTIGPQHQQIYTQQPQYIAQPQVHYQTIAQPQPVYTHQPQINYVHPQISHYNQPQVSYVQPQYSNYQQPQYNNYQQPQYYHAQPLALNHQQTVVAQPLTKVPVVAQQVYAHQPVLSKENAVSYASFSQGQSGPVQYAPVAKQLSYTSPTTVVSKQVVAPAVYQPNQYYQHPQQYQQVYTQDYSQQPQIYTAQPKVAYAQAPVAYTTQYYGKIAQASQGLTYPAYNH